MPTAAGLPLVCVHGWSLNGRVFDALRAALPQGYPLQTLDLPGHGGSPWQGELGSLEAQTAWLLQRLPPRCALLGWSLGGQLALQAANLRKWICQSLMPPLWVGLQIQFLQMTHFQWHSI